MSAERWKRLGYVYMGVLCELHIMISLTRHGHMKYNL